MNLRNGTTRRIGTIVIRLAAVFALALLLAGAVAPHAGAEGNNGPAMDKDAFKKGCQEGGGSYVENASDDSFGCNMKGGGSIKCTSTTSPCTYTPKIVSTGGAKANAAQVSSAGAMRTVSGPSNPTPTSTPTFPTDSAAKTAGGAKIVKSSAP